MSTGAKLSFYSCPPAHGVAFDSRNLPEQAILMMKASVARPFFPFFAGCRSPGKICLSKHGILHSMICALTQIIKAGVVVSSLLSVTSKPVLF